MTMAQTATLAFPATVPQEGGKRSNGCGPAAGNGQDGLPLGGPSPCGDRQAPGVPGNCLRLDGAPEQSPDPPQGPAKPPVQADRGARPSGRAPSGRFTGASSTGETASGVRSNALPPTSLNSNTELRP